jgi:ribosome-associated protein
MSDGRSERVEGPLRINDALTLPAAELRWRFSRSSGPGGQGVNTADSRAELTWSLADSAAVAALSTQLRVRLAERLGARVVSGEVVVAASEYRAQLRNREAARRRLAALLRAALAAPAPHRHATRPSRRSIERRLEHKRSRAALKRAGPVRPETDATEVVTCATYRP